MPILVKKVSSPHSLIEHIHISQPVSRDHVQTWYFQYHTSVTQCNSNDKIYIKAPVIDGSYCHLNSDFLLWIASATVLLLRYTPPAASQTTHCHGYGYYWLWRYKGDCVIVKSHVACIVLWCRPKHSVDVDAPKEMVWGVRGLSVWTMLLKTRMYYPW